MKVFVCVDDEMGTMFNHRRQSRDRHLCADVAREVEGRLFCTPYTAKLFGDYLPLCVCDDPFSVAGEKDAVFVEGLPLLPHLERIDTLVLYHWNCRYPHDKTFDLPLEAFRRVSKNDFVGYAHEKITKERYTRK